MTQVIQQLPETGYVRLKAILRVFPVSRSTWWEGVRKKRYPQPVKLGPRITAWKAEEIISFLAAQGK
jgi:prophage regulatory protein